MDKINSSTLKAINFSMNGFKGSPGFRESNAMAGNKAYMQAVNTATEAHRFSDDETQVIDFIHYKDVPQMMESCLQRFNDGLALSQDNLIKTVEVVAAFWAEFLLRIHPFVDGNGRTMKFVASTIFKKRFGLSLSNFLLINQNRRRPSVAEDTKILKDLILFSLIAENPQLRSN